MAKIKVHSLTGRITPELLRKAFRNVRRNRGAAGIDRVSIDMFRANLEQNLLALMRDLKTRGAYQPLPLRRVDIPKPGSTTTRPLGIPAVRDRVAQEVVRLLIEPIFEPDFHHDSYGFRPGRNCHQAVERVLELHRQGHLYVLDADIKGFFDNLPHPLLMAAVADKIADGNILGLIERFLKAGVMLEGVRQPTVKGTPQGGVISPLLANIALDRLDRALDEQGYRFVRYADDFVVLGKTAAEVQKAHAFVQHFLATLGLELSAEKTKQTHFRDGFTFLGFTISSWSVGMRPKSVEKFKNTIRELTVRKHNLDDHVVLRLNQVIRGTANFFATAFSSVGDTFRTLDRWVRMRLRCMKYKRKSVADNGRMRRKHFVQLGLLSLGALGGYRT